MAALSLRDNEDFIPINNNSELNSLTNNNNNNNISNNNNNGSTTSSSINSSATATNNGNLFNLTRSKGSNNNLLQSAANKRPRREIVTAKHYEQLQDFIPWKKQENYTGVCGLHEEIHHFYQYISPRPEEKAMREIVIAQVEEVILALWPRVQVEVFGSFRTGLYLPTSDIDLVIFGIDGKGAFEDLEKALILHGICDRDNIKCIHNAMVPIIKLTEKTWNYKMDIEFNIENSVKSAEIIETYIRKFEPLKYLVLVLKQFLFQRELNEVFSGGISSYTLVMMVVNFLQLHPRRYSDHPETNYGVLLIEFFELYGRHFNYHTTCIRIRNGGQYLTKEEYARSLPADIRMKYQPSFLCIEDPALFTNDIGKGSFRAAFVKQSFDYAYSVMSKGVLDNTPYLSLLLCIIFVSKEIHDYRTTVIDSFDPKLIANIDCKNTDIKADELDSASTSTNDVSVGDVVDNTRKNKSEDGISKKRRSYSTGKKEYNEKSNSGSESSSTSTGISTISVNEKQLEDGSKGITTNKKKSINKSAPKPASTASINNNERDAKPTHENYEPYPRKLKSKSKNFNVAMAHSNARNAEKKR